MAYKTLMGVINYCTLAVTVEDTVEIHSVFLHVQGGEQKRCL